MVSSVNPSNKRRIWVASDLMVSKFKFVTMDEQAVHGIIQNHTRNLSINFTKIYGLHTIQAMRGLREKLKTNKCISTRLMDRYGVFNAVLNDDDRTIGSIVQDTKTKDFREFLNDIKMIEITTGPTTTPQVELIRLG